MSDKKKVLLRGNVAKFPDDVPVQKAYNFLENSKNLPKSRIWYLMVEKQGDKLQLARYQPHKGADLIEIGRKLKQSYLEIIPEEQKELRRDIGLMEVSGEDKFVYISNIPQAKINGTPLISLMVEDLVSLLDKRR